jgi:DNA repair exonuclease SbcCD ATPase subunit
MPRSSIAHQQLEWSKQQLDEIDATLASLAESAKNLSSDARAEAERALAQIATARNEFSKKVDALHAQATEGGEETYAALLAKWTEVELGLQTYFASAATQADTVKNAFAARAAAQRATWQKSLATLQAAASETVERARIEVDAAAGRLTEAAGKLEAKFGQVATAGDESWKAIQSSIVEARAIQQSTWKKITDSFAKLG